MALDAMVDVIVEPLRWGTKFGRDMGVEPKIGGIFPPKWMVKIREKPYFLMDDLGGKPTIFGNIHMAGPVVLGRIRMVNKSPKDRLVGPLPNGLNGL